MTIKAANRKRRGIEIDITGPNGNAFVLIGTARQLAKQLNFGKELTEKITTEMTSWDYENILAVFEKHFGRYVTLYR